MFAGCRATRGRFTKCAWPRGSRRRRSLGWTRMAQTRRRAFFPGFQGCPCGRGYGVSRLTGDRLRSHSTSVLMHPGRWGSVPGQPATCGLRSGLLTPGPARVGELLIREAPPDSDFLKMPVRSEGGCRIRLDEGRWIPSWHRCFEEVCPLARRPALCYVDVALNRGVEQPGSSQGS
jgi:hypothetical protein